MTDTADKLAQFKAQRDAQIEAYRQAGDQDATLKGWASYAARLELHCTATASRLAKSERKLQAIMDASATSKLDPDCLFGHTYNDVEYQTTADSDDYVSVFIGGVDVTDVIDDRFKSVAESAHFWAAEKAGRESRDEARIDAFIERREAAADNYVGPM